MALRDTIVRLLGISTYQPPANNTQSLGSVEVDRRRQKMGGQLAPLPQTRLRWYLADLERAMGAADVGLLNDAGQMWRAIKRDGVVAGALSTLTDGLVALPRRWTGDEDVVAALEGRDGVASVFDNMCPSSELALLASDGYGLGVAVGELVPVLGRDYPVLCRLDPQWLVYRWTENRWYYQSVEGLLPITPGDGRWVLHIDGGRIAPWQNGRWYCLGQSWISKQHAMLHKANWESKLANPARVAVSPQGASEKHKQSWFQAVMAWSINTVFGMTPGYDVKLLESNGRGYESFEHTIAQSDREFVIGITGQSVSTDGGAGFQNSDIHRLILATIIKGRADALAHTVNTQITPPFVVGRWDDSKLTSAAALEWDTKPPKDLKAEGDAVSSFGSALKSANEALVPYGRRVDALELAARFGVALEKVDPGGGAEGDVGIVRQLGETGHIAEREAA